MALIIDLDPSGDELQYLTARPFFGPSRSRSVTIGRGEDQPVESVEPDEIVDLTFEKSTGDYSLEDGEYPLTSWRVHGELLRPGDCVEVDDPMVQLSVARYDITFLVIELIVKDRNGVTSIRGIPLSRNRDVLGQLPKKTNEVCRILQYDNNESRPTLLSVDQASVIGKRNIVLTNAPNPLHSGRGIVVCRWDFKIYTITSGRTSKPVEQVLERICARDILSQYQSQSHPANHTLCQSSEVLCQAWRGGRVLGGSWLDGSAAFPVGTVELDANNTVSTPTHRQPGQKYTVFDSFAGAGGVSRGAQMSGFKVTHAVDKAPDTWATYHMNFRDVRLYQCAVHEFIVRASKEHIRVDVLHLSPPCQYFSPAHTHETAHDDENIFALFSCNALINKVRPRLITVEQTFGITHDRHQEYLHGFINDFTQFGYSVRWKVVRLCTWGSAQDRKRLIMIAAAPGEKLPPFPKPTHSEVGGREMKPFMTIRKALSGLRRGDPLHDLDGSRRFRPRKAPYNPDRLSGTITTSGADFVYFDGSRDFTLREFASLQGFPLRHRFKGNRTSIKRQIGNAFPPNTVKVLYKHLEKWLLEQDGVLHFQDAAADAIMLDADDNLDGVIIVDDSDEVSDARNRSSSSSASPLSVGRLGSPDLIDLVDDIMEADGLVDSEMIDLT